MDKIVNRLLIALTGYGLFGYPINAALGLMLNRDTESFNIAIRIVVLIGYLFLFYMFILSKESVNKNKPFIYFLIFWIIYSIRFVYDISYREIGFIGFSPVKAYQLTYLVTVFPTLVTLLMFKRIDPKNCFWYFYILLLISNAMIAYLIINGKAEVDIKEMRLDIKNNNGDSVINAITISLWGSFLILFTIIKFVFFYEFQQKSYLSLLKIFSYLVGIGLGFTNLTFGASRGPLLFTILIFLIILLVYIKKLEKTPTYFFKLLIIISPVIYFIFNTVIPFFIDENATSSFKILSRLKEFFNSRQKGELEERDYAYQAAWDQFVSSPFIGDKIIEDFDNYYPHNMVLESLMATGILGSFFYFSLLIMAIYYCYLKVKVQLDYSLFYIVTFFLFLMLGLTSGCIALSNTIWVSLAIIITSKQYVPYKKI